MSNRQIFATLLLGALCSSAQPADEATDPSAYITATLQARFPGLQIEHIAPVPHLPGIYEVATSTEIVYTNASADLLISGIMVDTRTHSNLTAQRWSDLHRIEFDSLPFHLAIRTVRGDGRRRLAVFEDPDCPYCEKLEHELQSVSDVTVYTFLYPLEGVHPEARQKATDVWCSQDRVAAWSEWMLKRIAPKAASCDDPIAELLRLGETLHVVSTPTLFFADGRRNDGALTHEQLEKQLAQATSVAQRAN